MIRSRVTTKMRVSRALLISLITLLGIQGPLCALLCDVATAAPQAATTASRAHAEAAPCHDAAPAEPSREGCPDDCSGCREEAPVLGAAFADSAPALSVFAAAASAPALATLVPTVALGAPRPDERPPPKRLFHLKSSLLL